MPDHRHIGVLLFDGVGELDVAGPYDVLAHWTRRHPEDGWRVTCLSVDGRGVLGANGLGLGVHHSVEGAPGLAVLVHPGGPGAGRLRADPAHLDWLRARRLDVPLLASVGTGSLVYAAAGLLTGRAATTHWASLNALSEIDPSIRVDVDARFVDDGDVVTGAGASAGIDLGLHLVARLAGVERAREVCRVVQYDPRPAI